MHGGGHAVGWMGHALAALALAIAAGLVGFMLAGGEPFGQIVGSSDVSAPTSAAPSAREAPAAPVEARLRATPPFKAKAVAAKPRSTERVAAKPRKLRRRPATVRRRSPVVRVVSPPPAQQYSEPVAAVQAPAGAPAPRASRPPAAPSGGGKPQQWSSAEG
jgi:hypothetical protein